MTTTDQAFIRAYQQPAAQPAQETPAQETRLQETTPHARTQANDMKLWASSVQYATPFSEASFSETAASETALSQTAAEGDQTRHRVDETVSKKPTLSAVLASRQQPRAYGESETAANSFRLPTICRQLLDNHTNAYEQVVSTLLANLDEGRTVIGMASCQTGAGCTTNLLCLASRLLAQGKSVVLVDANFSKPDLANVLGLHPTTTWQDVLHAGAPIAEALIRSTTDGLTVLPSAPLSTEAANAQTLTDTARLQASVTAGALRYEFDVALVDLGAVHSGAANSGAAGQATGLELAKAMRIDATLLVVDPARNDLRQQHNAQQRLEQHGCTVLGTIETSETSETSAI